MRKIPVVILVLAVVAVLVAGCGKSDRAVLRYSSGIEPETIDPRKSTAAAESIIEAQLFEGLVSLDEKDRPAPAAAESWSVSSDGLVWTFKLRKNMRWSNGDPLTAGDFEYSWKSTLDPKTAGRYAYQLFRINGAEEYHNGKGSADAVGIKATDDITLRISLKYPVPYFLTLLAHHTFYPVHRATVEADAKWVGKPEAFVGNGPFVLTGWTHHSKMTFAKNEQYWDKENVKLKGLEFFLVDNSNTELRMFENGQIDMGDNPPRNEFERLEKEKMIVLSPYFGTYFICLNVKQKPLDDVRVRRALQLAVNRKQLVEKVTRGGEQPALSVVPPGAFDVSDGDSFRNNGGDLIKDNDVQAARKLLAEAGYPGGKGFPELVYYYNTQELNKAVAESLQEMWSDALGVKIRLVNQEWKVFMATRQHGDYMLARYGWMGDYFDAMTMLDLFVTGGGNNDTQWGSSKYDSYIKTATYSNDRKARSQALHDAEKLLIDDDAVIVPLYFYTRPALMKPYVKGVVLSGLGYTYFKTAYLD